MARRDPSGSGPSRPSRARTGAIAGGAAVILAAAATATALAVGHSGGVRHSAAHDSISGAARLIASSCSGPAGAAYVADAGWDGFSAIDTSTCKVIQTYNVGDTQVPGDAGDYNYSSTNEGVAIHGSTLYFADTGTSNVAVIDTSSLDPTNYNPAEKLINVGLFPQDLAVTPDGSQVWVADTGPQTSPASPSGVSVISTASDTVTARLSLGGQPSQIAFSPSGATAYVVTSEGLWTYSTATGKVVNVVRGLGDPHGVAVSPDGATVYVTDTEQGTVAVINATTGRINRMIKVGQLPWQVVVSANGQTVYVANPDSDSISVINAAAGTVSSTIPVTGDPDTLALTPNGQQLWIGQNTAALVTVVDTATNTALGSINLGGTEAQSGDGYEPTGIALTSTPTPGS
jgi:YVTN family beta-propeller protein